MKSSICCLSFSRVPCSSVLDHPTGNRKVGAQISTGTQTVLSPTLVANKCNIFFYREVLFLVQWDEDVNLLFPIPIQFQLLFEDLITETTKQKKTNTKWLYRAQASELQPKKVSSF